MSSDLDAEYIGVERRTEGSEPSQYLEEEKTIVIPSVAASERGTAQTGVASATPGLWGLGHSGVTNQQSSRRVWKGSAIEGDSPVGERLAASGRVPEYHGTRETLWESGGTILQG